MSWIQNISVKDLVDSNYDYPGDNSVLIQILDPGSEFPTPPTEFTEIYQFQFYDAEKNDVWADDKNKINNKQAFTIGKILEHALSKNMNVIVHCYYGISRSRAVAEVGIKLGFKNKLNWGIANNLVKSKILQQLKLEHE